MVTVSLSLLLALTVPIPLAPAPYSASAASMSAHSYATPADSIVELTLRRIIETGHHPYLKWPDFPHYRDELESLYGPAPYSLRWLRDDGLPTPAARAALEALGDAESRGLDPEDYDVAHLSELLGEATDGVDGAQVALLDAGLSVAYLRYLSDLHIGRVNPANLSFGYNIEAKKLDLAAVVREAIDHNRIGATVSSVEPQFPQYARLIEVLAEYRRLAEIDREPFDASSAFEAGDEFAQADALRAWLIRLGDMDRSAPAGSTYDSTLVAGVMHFQARHGLEADGVLGPATFAALNVPMADRVAQIKLALERVRWLPELTEPVIVVNVPAFELWGLDPSLPGQKVAINMRVVVGKALNKQTPAFSGDMEYVVMSPYWNVPYSIAARELLPSAMKDPNYLSRNRFEIVRDFSWESKGLRASQENLAAVRSGHLKLRQLPGGRNSLGHVKFIFPNAENVYLHDTPAHELFERTRRDFSHGCIRLSDPAALARWVLRDQRDWTPERIAAAMDSDSPTRVDLTKALPVIIFYTTTIAYETQPHFYDDLYGHDDILRAALRAGYPYPA